MSEPAPDMKTEDVKPNNAQDGDANEAAVKTARAASRGGLFVLGAKAFFLVLGFVQNLILPQALGLAGYGALSRVLAASNVLNNVVISGSTQGVSRAVAGARGHERAALDRSMRVHAPLAALFALLLFAGASRIAAFEHAPQIQLPLMIMAGVLGVYGVYAPLIGYFNGKGAFGTQASLDVAAATLRTIGLAGVGYMVVSRHGSGVVGATAGAFAASLIVFGLARSRVSPREPGAEKVKLATPREYMWSLTPVMLAQLFTNGLMQADITVLGRFLSISSSSEAAADEWVGVYRACQLFAFLPYQLLFSVTQILFPMLARAQAEGSHAEVQRLVSRGTRLGTIVAGAMVSIVIAIPEPLLRFAYGAEVATRGADTLRVLAIGQGAFCLLGLATTVLVSIGSEVRAMAVTLSALVLVVVACFTGAAHQDFGAPQLTATAYAVTFGLALGLVAGAIVVRHRTGAFVPMLTLARTMLAITLCAFIGSHMPHLGKLLTPILAIAIGAVYVITLLVTREIGAADLALVRGILRKKR